ncbi:hypothetical protein DFH09DRAFT_1395166 [Mycena vulgaris]|nr:hypothetical protein DFH09DRAFT_1395166 [Mycena vulgaris]
MRHCKPPHISFDTSTVSISGSVESLVLSKPTQPSAISPSHLKAVYTTLTLFSASAIALQQLLALPTLRSTQIGCASYDPATFMRIWDRCSPTIRHLGIHLRDLSIEEVPPTLPPRFAQIRLESLRLTGMAGLGAWLNHEYCPFDLSGLRVLSILGNNEAFRWPKLSAGLATVEVLDLRVNEGHTPIDLSPFRGLTLMRIWSQSQRGWPKELDTLAPSNRIRTLVLAGSFSDIAAEALASALAPSPIPGD